MTANRRGDRPVALRAKRASTGKRRSTRLPAYDYSTPGEYFVTICTHDRRPILADDAVRRLVQGVWNWLPRRFPSVQLDEFVIMPDHVHCILCLRDVDAGGPSGQGAQMRAPTLGNVVGTFKAVVARSINERRGTIGERVWQRNYYEHIVRNEEELGRIREYIWNNPFAEHYHASDDLSGAWREDQP